MAKARFQFTLPQVATFTVWLAAVFAAAHYALRLPLVLVLFLVFAVGGVSYLILVLGYTWVYQRETRCESISPGPSLLDGACIVMLVAASVMASIAIVNAVPDSRWAALILSVLCAAVAANALWIVSACLMADRRRKRARAARGRLAELLIEGRALLDQQLPDEAAFADWQRQVAAWRTECERSLATWLTPRELAEIFAPSDTASIWIHRVHHEHDQALGNLEAWLDRLRLLHSSSRWP